MLKHTDTPEKADFYPPAALFYLSWLFVTSTLMGKFANEKKKKLGEYNYFFLDLSLFRGISGVISPHLLLFPVGILRHGISFTHIASAEKDPVTCLGTTLEFPEVAADILQQTNFSLELPRRNREPALTPFDWPSRSSGRRHLVHMQEAGDSQGQPPASVPLQAGPCTTGSLSHLSCSPLLETLTSGNV